MTEEKDLTKNEVGYAKLEQKLGFDRIREAIAARCSTEYARSRC